MALLISHYVHSGMEVCERYSCYFSCHLYANYDEFSIDLGDDMLLNRNIWRIMYAPIRLEPKTSREPCK